MQNAIHPHSAFRSNNACFDLRWVKVEEFLNAKSYAVQTKKTYRRELRRLAEWLECSWSETTPHHLVNFCLVLKKQGLQKASRNRAIAAIRSFFRWLNKAYPAQYPSNPTLALEFEKLPVPPANDLSAAEMESIWAAIFQEPNLKLRLRDAALFVILQYGLRASEAAALNVGDYDGLDLQILEAKDDSTGSVRLLEVLRVYLDNYLSWRQLEGDRLNPDSPLLLAYSSNSEPDSRLTYPSIYYLVSVKWQSHCPTNINLHPHRMRHTFATDLMRKTAKGKIDVTHARTLLRHRDQKSFMRYAKSTKISAAKEAYDFAFQNEKPFGFYQKTE